RAVMVVAIQRIVDRNTSMVEITSIDEINILPAVAIEIGDADSRTKLLAINRDALIPFKVHKLDTRCGSHICELDRTWTRVLCRELCNDDQDRQVRTGEKLAYLPKLGTC